ncbi:MAG: DMT family transporter, partial [Lachnospiraceae bacterium]|nr:DMT family transporter [Lachnospiraceae bacterium]
MKKSTSYFFLFIGVFALSTSAIFVKVAQAPSAVVALYRLLITAVVLLPFLLLSKKHMAELKALNLKQWITMVTAGILLAVHYIMWFESLNLTSVSSSAVLVSLQPLYSMVLGRIFLKEHVKPGAILGGLIAIVGSAVIGWGDFQLDQMALSGDVLAFLAAGVIALYYLCGQVVRKQVSALTYSVPAYFSSVVFLLIYNLIKGDSLTGFNGSTWMAFLGIALIATIGGQFVFNLLLKDMSATAVTMGILGEPVGTCILAALFLSETIAPRQLVGIFIIVIGLAIYFFAPGKDENKSRHGSANDLEANDKMQPGYSVDVPEATAKMQPG